MCNLWPYKNHHYRPNYPIVLLQEHCEKVQFKSRHPVCQEIMRKKRKTFIALICTIAFLYGFSLTYNNDNRQERFGCNKEFRNNISNETNVPDDCYLNMKWRKVANEKTLIANKKSLKNLGNSLQKESNNRKKKYTKKHNTNFWSYSNAGLLI